MTGTVFDIGYQSYTGAREGRWRSRRAVFKDGIRIALGLGRGGRAKLLPWSFLSLFAGIALIMAIVAGAVNRLGGPGAAEEMSLPKYGDYYSIIAMILFVFAAVIAPELLCSDRREGTINLYLVRPLTSTDYVAARWLSFLVVMLAATWIPQFILLFGLAGGDPAPMEYLKKNWLDIPRFLGAGLAMSLYCTSLAMLTASFTKRRAYASVFLVGLFVISMPFTIGLAEEMDGDAAGWMSMFNLTNIPLHVNDILFGEASELTEDAPARRIFTSASLIWWWAAWVVVPTAVLWWRYRKLMP